MSRLHKGVIAEIKQAGLTVDHYIEHCGYEAGAWGGDVCGCSDDRCVGYHHSETEECGCFDWSLHEAREEHLSRSEFKSFLSLLSQQELSWFQEELTRVSMELKAAGKFK